MLTLFLFGSYGLKIYGLGRHFVVFSRSQTKKSQWIIYYVDNI